jgi:hypothetical protein
MQNMQTDQSDDLDKVPRILAAFCRENGVSATKMVALSEVLASLNLYAKSKEHGYATLVMADSDTPSDRDLNELSQLQWTQPYKLGLETAREILIQALPGIASLLDEKYSEYPQKMIRKYQDARVKNFDFTLSILGRINRMPEPNEPEFHMIGSILHAVASSGSRRGMWSLAHHLKVYAAHPHTNERVSRQLTNVASQWEALSLSTRMLAPKWVDTPVHLTPLSDRWNIADQWLESVSGQLAAIMKDRKYSTPLKVDLDEHLISDRKEVTILDQIGGLHSTNDDTANWRKTEGWRVLLQPMPIAGRFDPDITYRALRREFPWMDEANVRAGEMVAGLRAGRPAIAPLLMIGEPGIGKTAWAKRLAELCRLPHILISVATGTTSMTIGGNEREWTSSSPCIAAKVARDTLVANPMIIIDEIDKAPPMGPDANASSVYQAFLPLLDALKGISFFDVFLYGHLDLSRFNWLFLGNSLAPLPAPFVDRLTRLPTRRPSLEEVERSLDAMTELWLPGENVSSETKLRAIAKYRESRSLRELRATVEQDSLQKLWRPDGPRSLESLQNDTET